MALSDFTFVKLSVIKLEKYTTYSNDDIVGTPELKKRVMGMYLVETTTSDVDYKSSSYIKFSSIPVTEKFKMVTNAKNYESYEFKKNLIV